ncbi:GNAT family N-acetyltransferase [Paenibacillus lautus]|uniref:GNAT family N-acetyltransferase n=1 Tax=Paenibacillus lautus TaxID=1401 RepID=UPI002DBFC4D0|nr:GNAT family N-acetyltransferase [Paenibacillus lautus]MEC0204771.1 GNAT family N-acetyltransferase [Paenibacillus lautus]
MIRRLLPEELGRLLETINREQHFLYYSYLTFRKNHTVHYGQFSEYGELLGVTAFLKGLPFYAFSVYPLQTSFQFLSVLTRMKRDLELPDVAIGSFIVNEDEWEVLNPEIDVMKPPAGILLMKHRHLEDLPLGDDEVFRLDPSYFDLIESKMAEFHSMAFAREELQNPFYGVVQDRKLIAVGGYHIYSDDYVELGNIGTDAAWRRQGYGKKVCAELTRKGRAITPDVYLNVLEENLSAVRLYQSLGYITVCKQYIVEFAL